MDKIAKIRAKIDKIDEIIIKLLEKRGDLSQKIGKNKKKKSISIEDISREEEILNKISDPSIKKIYKKVLEESKKKQKTL
ncbi:chorismate mutase [Candidatus Peregrinibacteria bacterium]|nr:chorismate mutase [Candidatus Peregrinibacteria bacterium]